MSACIALTMGQQANYVQALSYMEQALEINQRLEDDYGVSTLLQNIGNIYHENLCDFSRGLNNITVNAWPIAAASGR